MRRYHEIVRVLALAWLGIFVAGCGGAGVFACTDASECGASGTCEANGFCSFPDDTCASGQRYGAHAPGGIADVCVEPLAESSSGAHETTTSTTSTASLTIATLDGDGPTSAAESSSSTTTSPPDETTSSVDDGTFGSSTTSEGGSTQIGPLVISDDLDDGAMWPTILLREGAWMPSGEEPGLGFCGEYPVGERYFAYLRFTLPQAVPADATITSATLELFGHATYLWSDGHALRVWAQESDDAPQVSGLADYPDAGLVQLGDLSLRWADADDAGLTWAIPGPNASPDLAAVLQHLVDGNGGLDEGAHIQLWVAEDELGGMGEEVGWYDSIAGAETSPRLTLTIE